MTTAIAKTIQIYLPTGVMEERDGEYVFTQDFLFSSPSTAAAVVLGRSANGWVSGKTIRGTR